MYQKLLAVVFHCVIAVRGGRVKSNAVMHLINNYHMRLIVMKKIFVSLIFFLILFFSFPSKQFAQLASLSRGDRIRITSQEYFYQPLVCKFDQINLDTMAINISSKIIFIPLGQIQRIEFSESLKHNTVNGAILGSIFGGISLGITMYLINENSGGWSKVGQPGFWGGLISGVLIGGGIGAIIGYNYLTDDWQEIRIIKRIEL
ncbi:MAG: hypothetical protein AUK34_10255 [Ignavibacteria bacterium CG2_30_36_16]|nr:MAG: hypothetical protein AUK34_10255 [Ignavibacteria bacterium CG2_30_36_16]